MAYIYVINIAQWFSFYIKYNITRLSTKFFKRILGNLSRPNNYYQLVVDIGRDREKITDIVKQWALVYRSEDVIDLQIPNHNDSYVHYTAM